MSIRKWISKHSNNKLPYLFQAGRFNIVYTSLILLAIPEKDLKAAAASLTATDSLGCCQAHSNCNGGFYVSQTKFNK